MLQFDLQAHKPLREIVYEQLKLQILEGKIIPGTRMMEVNLAEEMGVSRTPVREAIRKLERDGLVVIEPRKGTYASEISTKDIIDTLIVREHLESLSAKITAETIEDSEILELQKLTDEYETVILGGNIEAMISADEEFHKKIVQFSKNKTLIQLSETVQELALRFRYLYYDDFSRYRHMPEEHSKIIATLKSHDCEAAEKASFEHVYRLREFVNDQHSDNSTTHNNSK